MKEKTEDILLTSELYKNLLEEKSGEILGLKTQQNSSLEVISSKLKELYKLKLSLKSLKKSIRITKRALRKERRKLRKINQSLVIQKNSMANLNSDFISEKKIYIKLDSFKSKKYN